MPILLKNNIKPNTLFSMTNYSIIFDICSLNKNLSGNY